MVLRPRICWLLLQVSKSLSIAAALIRNAAGEVPLVRKKETRAFMQPCGKIDAGETSPQALIRELKEELGLEIIEADLVSLGRFEAEAANEPDTHLTADLFALKQPVEEAHPAQEIAQAIWVNPRHTGLLPLAPFTRDTVLPLAISG